MLFKHGTKLMVSSADIECYVSSCQMTMNLRFVQRLSAEQTENREKTSRNQTLSAARHAICSGGAIWQKSPKWVQALPTKLNGNALLKSLTRGGIAALHITAHGEPISALNFPKSEERTQHGKLKNTAEKIRYA